MSVIIAKSAVCCGTTSVTTYNCFPAVSIEHLVSTGTSSVIDGIATTYFSAAHWHVYIANASQTRVVSYQATAIQNGPSPTFNTYAFLGDMTIAVAPSVSTVGGVLSLSFSNSDSEDFLVCVTRTAVPTDYTQSTTLELVEVGSGRSFVQAGTTSTLDFIDSSIGINAVHWILTITDSTGNRLATQLTSILGTTLDAVEFGKLGDSLAYTIGVTGVTGQGTELTITNTGTVDYKVNLTRIPIQVQTGIPYCGSNSRGLSLWTPQAVTVIPTATLTVDTITIPAHTCAKWLATITNTTTQLTMGCEIVATIASSGPIIDVYGNVGQSIKVVFGASNVGGLNITALNNEANDIVINLLRIPTQT